jgi:hypothetical protein
MKSNRSIHFILALAFSLNAGRAFAAPFGTAFTYQGRLSTGANGSNGLYDYRFSLWDAAGSGATLIGTTQEVDSVTVSNGLFTVNLDFGPGAFNGASRWLELGVRTNGAAAFGILSPRQNLTPAPYAIAASNLSGTLSAAQLTGTLPAGLLAGTYNAAVTFNNSGNLFVGNGAGLTGVNASTLGGYSYCALPCYWNLVGNSGTTAGVNFVGTTDNQPLELKVNSQRAFRLEPTTNSPNVVGGYVGNFVTNIAVGVTIAGGGAANGANTVLIDRPWDDLSANVPHFGVIGGGNGNLIDGASYGTISGGHGNDIEGGHYRPISYATIGGGLNNFVGYVLGGTIAGGADNYISGDSAGGGTTDYSTIGGGTGNQISDGSGYTGDCTIGGGQSNQIFRADSVTIGGGSYNSVGADAFDSTIGGGLGNRINAVCSYATISGGLSNYMDFYAAGATICGGGSNHVWFGPGFGGNSFATIPGGRNNSATNYAFAAGCRAQAIHQGAFVWADNNEFDFASTSANSFSARSVGGARFVSAINGSGTPSAGVVLPAGGGSWTSLSDKNAKENVVPVSGRQILEELDSVPIATWNYKAQDKSIRHIGPMAQDFAAAFKVGEDNRGITTVDADGVALAAIQGLNESLKEKDARIRSLEEDVAELKSLVRSLSSASKGGGQ